MNIVIAIIIFALFFFAVERGLYRLFGIKRISLRDTEARKLDKWCRIIIVIMLLCYLPFMVQLDTPALIWFWVGYLSLMMGCQAVLEWKYIQSKQYVTTIILWIIGVGGLFWVRGYFGG